MTTKLEVLKLKLQALTDEHFGNQCSDNLYATSGRWRAMTNRIDDVALEIADIAKATDEPCPKCGGTGVVDAPFSGSDPCCPECGGSGRKETPTEAYKNATQGV